ncbi:organic cation transporter protein [Elysia marginata]|uniref:Organic cation transporter protein n=1 Tax=Elysia marginata TaxID=1093978 RepID=A0AAV4H130_9GAST|nr:organic cation transporter protein [Elysia marginata]
MKFDDILTELGEFGPYQKRIYFLMCLAHSCIAMQILAGVFIQATPEHRCAIPDLPNDSFASQGHWHDALVNASIPWASGDQTFDQCKLLDIPDGRHNETVPCEKWVYDKQSFKRTFVTAADLVCNKRKLVTYASMVLMGGMLIGSLVLGILADTLGRRKILVLSTLGHFTASLCVPWTRNYTMFVIIRFFVSFFGTGMFLSAFVMGMELVGPNWRKFAGNAMNLFWSIGLLIEAGLAYMLRDWVYLQIAISVPLLPVFFCYFAFIQESPRWLLQQGRLDEASKVLENVAKKNGVVVPETIKNLQDVVQEKAEKNLWHLFTSTTLLIRSLIIFLNWMVSSMIFYGLSLNSGDLSGNIYVNFVLMATAELVSFLFALLVMDITGRKMLHCYSMVVGGVACLATMFPVMYGGNDVNWLTTALSLVGKFGSTVGFAVIYVYAAELFPTVLRNSIIGICSVCARIGGILAPFIGDMIKFGGKTQVLKNT